MSEQTTNREILRRMDTIEQLLTRVLENQMNALTTQAKNRIRRADMRKAAHPALQRERVDAMESVFHKITLMNYYKRHKTYRFPKAIMEDMSDPYTQTMLASVLINNASLRSPFRPVAGESVLTAQDVARKTLEDCNLIVMPMNRTDFGGGDTLVVMSPAAAVAFVRDRSTLPREWKGWTCKERHTGNAGASGFVQPLPDPSGTRRWAGIVDDSPQGQDDVVGDPRIPAKPRATLSGFSPAVVNEGWVDDEEEESGDESNSSLTDEDLDDEDEQEQSTPEAPSDRPIFDPSAWEAAGEQAPLIRKALKISIKQQNEK